MPGISYGGRASVHPLRKLPCSTMNFAGHALGTLFHGQKYSRQVFFLNRPHKKVRSKKIRFDMGAECQYPAGNTLKPGNGPLPLYSLKSPSSVGRRGVWDSRL